MYARRKSKRNEEAEQRRVTEGEESRQSSATLVRIDEYPCLRFGNESLARAICLSDDYRERQLLEKIKRLLEA